MKGIDKASLNAADPEADDGSDDDEDRFKIESKQPHEGANETFVPAINHATDQMRAANEAAKDAEGWKDNGLTIVCNDTLLKECFKTYQNARRIMHWQDPRMTMIDSALWTWKLLCIRHPFLIMFLSGAFDDFQLDSILQHCFSLSSFREICILTHLILYDNTSRDKRSTNPTFFWSGNVPKGSLIVLGTSLVAQRTASQPNLLIHDVVTVSA